MNLPLKYFKLIIVFVLLLCFFISCNSKKEQNHKPKFNVLLLYMDDLRPELNSYGQSQIKSPNIDALASSGIQFNEAYCNVPVCGASRASMLTGMYPTKNRFINYNTFVNKETPTAVSLPMLFKQNGYTTISNGKVYHHLDDNMQDWDEVWRPYAFDTNDKGLAPTDYWQSLWKDYQNPNNIKLYKKTGTGPAYEKANVNDTAYIDGLMTQKVIRDLKKLKNNGKPFFLTAGFIVNHLPFNAPKKYWDLYSEESIKQPYNNYIPKNAPKISISTWGEMRAYTYIPKEGQVTDSVAKELIHGYYATVSYVDALIGKIINTLKNLELDKNTIVILVSDHGYNLQEHTQWAKFTSHRISTRVPLIISSPTIQKGVASNALIELVDIYPTLAELCGLEIPKNQLDGKSFVKNIEDSNLKGKEYVFSKKGNAFTIKTPEYCYTEYINYKNNTMITNMLFDHIKDTDENENVVDKSEYKEIVVRLQNILHTEFESNIIGR